MTTPKTFYVAVDITASTEEAMKSWNEWAAKRISILEKKLARVNGVYRVTRKLSDFRRENQDPTTKSRLPVCSSTFLCLSVDPTVFIGTSPPISSWLEHMNERMDVPNNGIFVGIVGRADLPADDPE